MKKNVFRNRVMKKLIFTIAGSHTLRVRACKAVTGSQKTRRSTVTVSAQYKKFYIRPARIERLMLSSSDAGIIVASSSIALNW
jgi:hypothetical protein